MCKYSTFTTDEHVLRDNERNRSRLRSVLRVSSTRPIKTKQNKNSDTLLRRVGVSLRFLCPSIDCCHIPISS